MLHYSTHGLVRKFTLKRWNQIIAFCFNHRRHQHCGVGDDHAMWPWLNGWDGGTCDGQFRALRTLVVASLSARLINMQGVLGLTRRWNGCHFSKSQLSTTRQETTTKESWAKWPKYNVYQFRDKSVKASGPHDTLKFTSYTVLFRGNLGRSSYYYIRFFGHTSFSISCRGKCYNKDPHYFSIPHRECGLRFPLSLTSLEIWKTTNYGQKFRFISL